MKETVIEWHETKNELPMPNEDCYFVAGNHVYQGYFHRDGTDFVAIGRIFPVEDVPYWTTEIPVPVD